MAPLTLPKLLNVNVIDVIEDTPPEGCEAVRWILVTREPIDTQEDVERVVDIYRCRWLIEEYFKALKTGCAFEKRQLKSRHALLNALGIFSVIAWRLLQLRALSRSEPSAPASTAISNRQISLLGKIRQQQRKPALSNAPTMEEVTLAIAQLGGHIKNNGPPGWIVLGRGYESLLLLELGWNAAHDHLKHVGQCSCDQ